MWIWKFPTVGEFKGKIEILSSHISYLQMSVGKLRLFVPPNRFTLTSASVEVSKPKDKICSMTVVCPCRRT